MNFEYIMTLLFTTVFVFAVQRILTAAFDHFKEKKKYQKKRKKCHMYKPTIPPQEAEQWLVSLIELKNKAELTVKQISEKENLAEKSVSNVFSGKSKSPSVDLIRRIIHALGGTWGEIFAESERL